MMFYRLFFLAVIYFGCAMLLKHYGASETSIIIGLMCAVLVKLDQIAWRFRSRGESY